MKYYAHINSKNKLTGIDTSLLTKDEYGSENVLNIETTEENFNLTFEKGIDYFIYDGSNIIVNPNYEQEQKQKRQATFESQFILTSKGNYRLQPKGYANAQQSIDTINNIVNASGGLTEQIASMVIFYDTPDFTKPEECTEEWLVQHQHHPEPMTKEQWTNFYIEFTTLYAQKQYKQN